MFEWIHRFLNVSMVEPFFFLSSFNGSMLEQYNVCNKRIQITHTHTTFKGHSRKRIEKNEWVINNVMIRHKNFRGFIWFIHAIRVFSRTFGFLNKTRSQRSNNKQSEGENRLSKHNIILLKNICSKTNNFKMIFVFFASCSIN